MKRLAVVGLLCCGVAHASPTPVPSYAQLTTGNGFGYSVFDANAHKVTTFLERPYKYLTPGSDPHGAGVLRRDLAYDVYFGARVGGATGGWLPDQTQSLAGHVSQSGILHTVTQLGAVKIESFYFSPFGLSANALFMVATATNTGTTATTVDLFALPNFRLGDGDPDNPSPTGETITTTGTQSIESGMLGESGGAMVYLPLGAIAKADCAGDGYAAVMAGGELPQDTRSCTGDDRTLLFQSTQASLAPGASASFGLAIGFSPTISGAGAVGSAMTAFIAARTPDKIVADALAEWEAWRKPPPSGLSDDETRIYRQAESTLRMAQVREPYSAENPKQKGHGMILAALPNGIWHIGWVRDATYATVALARSGHLDEAKDSLRFFLAAEASGYESYAGGPYRVSITRYFGDGQEETDWNAEGPNIEFDGWGLYLWALRQTIDASGDGALLDEMLPTNERFLDVVRSGVADPLVHDIEPTGLVTPDTSIWESHWNNRKHYAYTSLAAARGLCDMAAVETAYGDGARADALRIQAGQLRAAIRANLLDASLLLGGSKEGISSGTYRDGAAWEAFNWELFASDDPLYAATLTGLDQKLKLASGGYKRNDDGVSSYDSNEWIFVDLRASEAHRRMGDATSADALIAWITAQGRVNYDLLPELFNAFPADGPLWSYTGAIPMVGFGAAAYILAMRDRAGEVEAHDCGPGDPGHGDGGTTDGGVAPGKSTGCGCAIGGRAPISCGMIIALALSALMAAAIALRRR